MPDGLPQVQLVIWGMLLAATPTTAYAILMPIKYAKAQFSVPLAPEFDADRLILITLSMVAIGVVGLVIWDGVFPDRRDVRILGVLPIPTRHFVLARLASLGRVFVLFATPLCTLQSIVFGMTVTGFGGADLEDSRHQRALRDRGAGVRVRVLRADRGAVSAAARVRPPRRAGGVGHLPGAVRGRPGAAAVLPARSRPGAAARRGQPRRARATVGGSADLVLRFYEQLAGTADGGTAALARLAVQVTVGAAVLAVALYGVQLQRSVAARARRVAPDLGVAGRTRSPRTRRLSRPVNRPLAAAVRGFTVRTLIRSRTHRMMFAVYAGFALALILSSALSVAFRERRRGLWQPGLAMMSMPLIVQFLLLVALRAIVAIPSEPKARWVFRVCEPADRPAPWTARATRCCCWSCCRLRLGAAARAGVLDASARPSRMPRSLGAGPAARRAAGRRGAASCRSPAPISRATRTSSGCGRCISWRSSSTRWSSRPSIRPFPAGPASWRGSAWPRRSPRSSSCSYRTRVLTAMPALRFDEEDPQAIFQGFQLSEGLAAAPRAESITGIAPGSPELRRRPQTFRLDSRRHLPNDAASGFGRTLSCSARLQEVRRSGVLTTSDANAGVRRPSGDARVVSS